VLTPAEWEVVHLLRHGMSNRVIARQRGTSREAVKYHLGNIAAKLGLEGRQAIRQWPGLPAHLRRQRSKGAPSMAEPPALGPIGQIALTVRSLQAAEPFYRDVLGLPHLYSFGNLAFFDCAGTRLFLTAADDEAHSRNHSVVYFRVPDIHAAAAGLEAKGVRFESPPHVIHRHEDGTEEWMAFFGDGEGNTLALMSAAKTAR
jgi:predicted enzyme related to lactoylglutathione lyase